MNKPLVSIFCVSYNHEQFIAQALDGFVMQKTNFDYEIVISDDCSTDNTKSIINEYIKKYPKLFKDVSPRKNLGMQKNWLHTLNACTGKYIALCEGDDYWTDANKLQKQVDFMEQHEDCALTYHPVNVVCVDGEYKYPYDKPKTMATTKDLILSHFIPTCSILFKQIPIPIKEFKILKKISGLDVALELLISLHGNFYLLNEKMATYQQHSSSVTKQKIKITKHKKLIIKEILFLKKFNKHTHFKYNNELTQKIKNLFFYNIKLQDETNNKGSFEVNLKLVLLFFSTLEKKTFKQLRHLIYLYITPKLYNTIKFIFK